jgi:hypothetical protein
LNKKGIGDGDEDASVDDDGVMLCPTMICVAARIMYSPNFLLQTSLRGGV